MLVPKRRVLPRVNESFAIGFQQLVKPAVILVVAFVLAGEQRVHDVVKIVGPLPVQAKSPPVALLDDPDVVQGAFRNQVELTSLFPGKSLHPRRHLLQDVLCPHVADLVDGVQPEPIDVVPVEPVQDVADNELPHLVTVGPAVVDRFAPRCFELLREIPPVLGQVAPFGTEVVVDYVQKNRHPPLVAGVDKLFQAFGTPVGVLHSVQIRAVVTPVAVTGKLGHRHELEGVDPGSLQLIEPGNDGFERPFVSKRSHVKFVLDHFSKRDGAPGGVLPLKSVVGHHRRRLVGTVRLVVRSRVGPLVLTVQPVLVPGAGNDVVNNRPPVSPITPLHGNQPVFGRIQFQFNFFRHSGPHGKLAGPVIPVMGALVR